MADLVHDVMPERYHDLDVGRSRIVLVDHGHVVLAAFSDQAHAYAAKVLTQKGVHLRLGTGVDEVRSTASSSTTAPRSPPAASSGPAA